MHTFGVKGVQGPIQSTKTEVWRTHAAKPEGEHDFEPNTLFCERGAGSRIKPWKT